MPDTPAPIGRRENIEAIVEKRVEQRLTQKRELQREMADMVQGALTPILGRMDEMTAANLALGRDFQNFAQSHVELHDAELESYPHRVEALAISLGIPTGLNREQKDALILVTQKEIDATAVARAGQEKKKFWDSRLARVLVVLTILSILLSFALNSYLAFHGVAHPLNP